MILLASEYDRLPKALDGVDVEEIKSPTSPFTINYNEETLVAFALVEAGRTLVEVKAGARATLAGRTPEPCAGFGRPRR